MKINVTKEWCLRSADIEGDSEIGAGYPPIFSELQKAIDCFNRTQQDLVIEKFLNSQFETVLRLLARRTGGKIEWTREELEAAKLDDRPIMLGGLDLELYEPPVTSP